MDRNAERRLARRPLERLQRRLELALDEAATADRLHHRPVKEVEITGLHKEDLDIIKSWLVTNDQWVHACQELIYARPSPMGKSLLTVRCLRCGLQVNGGPLIERCSVCMNHKVCSNNTCTI
jgi:hypothetical protein